MKQPSLFLIFTFILLLLATNLAAALYPSEAAEIPYQINNSDRIVTGLVSEINVTDYYTDNTITVKEWLYNPISKNTIIVRTYLGTNWHQEDEAQFTQNESVLLMLKDQNPDKGVFTMSLGESGKHPISDRDAVIKELIAQGKWKGEDQAGNTTNESGIAANTGTTGEQKTDITENKTVDDGKAENTVTVNNQEGKSDSTPKSNSTPFISSFWVLAAIFGAFLYLRKTN